MTKKPSIRVNKIEINAYKGIDHLELLLSPGKMASDPDVNILGSMNGIGKTSTLECCALLLAAASSNKNVFRDESVFLAEAVKSGEQKASISGDILVGKSEHHVEVKFDRDGLVETNGPVSSLTDRDGNSSQNVIRGIQGFYSDPVFGKSFIFLHSYRKVQEGRPDLGSLLEEDPILDRRFVSRRYWEPERLPFSMFKSLIVRHLMESANLFETPLSSGRQSNDDMLAITTLDNLLKSYAGVRVGKLRPFRNNTIDVQVEHLNAPGKGFSIDGLSSGQKEIIASLFLIWNTTYKRPSVVLIDEPELHLNVQWHSGFVDKLLEIAPDNQYIMATHAEAIMDSVRSENRHLLLN